MSQSFTNRIFLIGFMGCGKSKLGKATAAKLNKPFIDLDEHIESTYQMSIPEIFSKYGESGFREREREALQNLSLPENAIIATGGGVPCFYDNMEWMNNNGITIFIDTPVKVLADRLINARVERPLLKGKTMPELISFIESKLAERRGFYEKANLILKGVDLNAGILIEKLESFSD